MLKLSFSNLAGRVLVSCDPVFIGNLQELRGRYASSASISNQSFDLEIDDFLLNLRELARWPSDDLDIQWDGGLRRIVEGNLSDAQALEVSLATAAKPIVAEVELGPAWHGNLTNFQLRDLAQLRSLNHGANFSVPGAGKTRVTLAVFQASRLQREVVRMLVVCPKSAFESWQEEAKRCFPDDPLRVAIVDTPSIPAADVILINYERLPDACSALIQWLQTLPALLVLDEAHRMKLGPAGAWGRACLALGPWAVRRLILSGTPAPNGPRDLENLFGFVWPGLGRAAVTGALLNGDLRSASKRLRPLFARTNKTELPLRPPDIAIRPVILPPLHRDIYDAMLGHFSGQWLGNGDDLAALGKVVLYLLMAATSPALLATGSTRYEPLPYRLPPIRPLPDSTLAELMRDLPNFEMSPKYQAVMAIVHENASLGRKTLVWSTFVRNLKSLELLLANYRPAIIHGGSTDRQEQLARFRAEPQCFVLLTNPATLGEGVSLHDVCHDAVYVDRDFAAGRFLQSVDRIHRLGLKPDEQTRVTILVAEETIDELVVQRLSTKLTFMGTILDDPSVLELADLDEEPTVAAGLDSTDCTALLRYLNFNASSR